MSRNYKVSRPKKPIFTLTIIAQLVSLTAISSPFIVSAAESDTVEFSSTFLRSPVDVSSFSQGNPVLEGNYPVDLYINDRWKGRAEVKFKNPTQNSVIAQPCFNLRLISILGIDIGKLSAETIEKLKDENSCTYIDDIATGLETNYDVATQRLTVQVPQASLTRNPRGYVSPELWENGITAATLQYDYNAYHSEMSGSNNLSTQYLGLRGGINWDVWRMRYRGSFNWSNNGGSHYNSTNTYLERAIAPLQSKLVLGESTTDGQVFDSIGFRGVMLTSDDRMYMDSQRGFAPTITGVANTNALVTVTQRGNQIYESTVPPGPFIIDDLYPTGTGGDLLVTIKEANGSKRSFTVPFATITELLRPGTSRYTLMGGRYRNTTINENPDIMMGTLRHGFTNVITGYTGILGGQDYQSASAGIALNTSIGAISADITHARADLRNDITTKGESVRFAFSKILPVVDTNITLANYRYSSSGYYSIDDAMTIRDGQDRFDSWYSSTVNRKNRLQLSASQTLSETLGNLNITASTQDYWNRSGSDTEYQLGYTNSFKWFSLNVNASRTRDITRDKWDNKIAIGISLPLGNSSNAPYLDSTYVQEQDHKGLQNSISGSAGENRQYNYSAFANQDHYNDTGNKTTGGVSGNWTSPWSTVGGSFSAGSGYQQYGMTLSGGAVAYNNGVVLTPIMGDTIALVEADHAAGAKIANNNSLSLDGSGKAAVPYLTPYRQNTIELDPKGLSNDVSLEVTSQNSVPTAGAVVLMKYKTDIGYSVLLNIRHSGSELPFSASILDKSDKVVGYIAQGGLSFARVSAESGRLHVVWGKQSGQQCSFDYQLPQLQPGNSDMRQIDVLCQ